MMTLTMIREEIRLGRLVACRICGLLTGDGCPHVASDFVETTLSVTVPAQLFSAVAPSTSFTVRTNPRTGLPLMGDGEL